MSKNRPAPLIGILVASALALAACASAEAASSTPTAQAVAPATLLAHWDSADSAASTKNDLTALALSENGAALAFSAAGARTGKLSGQKQPAYQHVSPTFLTAGGTTGCVLAAAAIKLGGEELLLPDFSEFSAGPSGWTLTNHVMLAKAVPIGSVNLSGASPASTATVLPAAAQQQLSRELFARTIGARTATPARIAPSALVDRQLLGGWQFYLQQLSTAKMTATRQLLGSTFSDCAASTAAGTLVFLTLRLSDLVAPSKGGPPTVSLPPVSPDLQSLGIAKALKGKSITISRVESYLLQIPTAAGGQIQVLGMSDAPTAIVTG